jgi:ribosomal RNA assembly protein
MTQEIYAQNLRELLNNKAKIERELKVKLSNQGRNIFIDGPAENEYLTLRVIEAINLGFSLDEALSLKNEFVILHILNIRDVTRRKDLERIRARLIGTEGKTKNNIENLSDCLISIHDNQVGIIGEAGCIEETIIAMRSLIQGSKQGNVYTRLERKKKERRLKPEDIIKPVDKKKKE